MSRLMLLLVFSCSLLVSQFSMAGTYDYGDDGACHIFSNSGVEGNRVSPWMCRSGVQPVQGADQCTAGSLPNPYGGPCCPAGTLAVSGGCCPAGDGTCMNGF